MPSGAGTLRCCFKVLYSAYILPMYPYYSTAMAAAACLLMPMVSARTPEMLLQRSFSTPVLTYYLYLPLLPYIAMVAAACLLVPMVGARTRQSRFNHLAGFNKYFPALVHFWTPSCSLNNRVLKSQEPLEKGDLCLQWSYNIKWIFGQRLCLGQFWPYQWQHCRIDSKWMTVSLTIFMSQIQL